MTFYAWPHYTYVDYTADDWLNKLLYALPLHGLLQHNGYPNDDVLLQNNEDRNDAVRIITVQNVELQRL